VKSTKLAIIAVALQHER